MRGAAVSDLHLGYRAFAATEGGRNLRELDVERAWSAAVDRIVAAQPDLVTIAGDCLHHPRVSMHAVIAFRDGIRRIANETSAPVVVLQGNHEAARTSEILTPIAVARGEPRVHVVTEQKRLRLMAPSTGDLLAVTCVPFTALQETVKRSLEPDRSADVNMLLIHAAVNTSAEDAERLPYFYAGEASLDVGQLAEEYDVVAAGDYHTFRRLHPTRLAFYSGSIERTSSNIWPEVEPKGVVLYDTVAEQLVLDPVPTRPIHDLELAYGDDVRTPEELNDAVRQLLDRAEMPGSIVRLVVRDFPREERGDIDWSVVRELKARCAHFQLDLRYAAAGPLEFGDRRERPAMTLLDEASVFFDADDASVRSCALRYLRGEVAA